MNLSAFCTSKVPQDFTTCSKLFSVTVTKGSQTATKPLPSNLQLQLPTAALLELCNYAISKRQQAITTDELITQSCNCVLFQWNERSTLKHGIQATVRKTD